MNRTRWTINTLDLFTIGFTEQLNTRWQQLGESIVMLEKAAGQPVRSYGMAGRLYVSKSGWLLMSVPNALARGAFDALHEPGAELPVGEDGILNAHISVASPDELESIGGPDKISERGHTVHYTTGETKSVEPDGWDGYRRVWYITVISPQLEQIRKSYGLEPRRKGYDFHITFARRKSRVLQNNDISKAAAEQLASIMAARPLSNKPRSMTGIFQQLANIGQGAANVPVFPASRAAVPAAEPDKPAAVKAASFLRTLLA